MSRKHLYATSVLGGLVMFGNIAPTFAQQLEEVVVTARKTEENLMQVPLSIVAVTSAALESANIKDPAEIAAYTPGLFISYSISARANGRSLFFRGDPL